MKDLTTAVLNRDDLMWAYRLGKLVGLFEVHSVEDVVAALKACKAYDGYGPNDWQLMKRFIGVGSHKDIARMFYADFHFVDDQTGWAFSRFGDEFMAKLPKSEYGESI